MTKNRKRIAELSALKIEISRIMQAAINGYEPRYRLDGCILWGMVEREIHEAIDAMQPNDMNEFLYKCWCGNKHPIGDRHSEHSAFLRTWWLNLYPDGQCNRTLCETREIALNRCTYTGDTPDAVQVEVLIMPIEKGQR